MFFLYCCNWYLYPYITQHHKITEIVVFNVHTQLLSGAAVTPALLISKAGDSRLFFVGQEKVGDEECLKY